MDKFLDKYNLPKSNKDDINNINRSVSRNEIERKLNLFTMK